MPKSNPMDHVFQGWPYPTTNSNLRVATACIAHIGRYVKEGKGEKSSWLKEQKEGKGAAECDNERPDPVYPEHDRMHHVHPHPTHSTFISDITASGTPTTSITSASGLPRCR